jgi:alginate O-acetyltransferase complex protein AlgI
VQAVLLLFAFKYLVFATGAWNDLAAATGLPPLPVVHRWLLPLGISFFTFEFIHFAADTYWGRASKSAVGDYAAFILFFPSMVAGPIKRFQEFAPKLRAARFDPALAARGVTRILVGLAKKHALADTFSLWAGKLNGPALYTGHWYEIAGWIFAYGFQIYFDFSGYSDIAIGRGTSSASSSPRTSTGPISAATSPSSGTAGTSRSAAGSATTSTSRSAGRGAGARGRR